jgi:prevent-host-death family protein
MSKRIPAATARKQFASLVARSNRGERIKVTRYNKTLAVLIPKTDLEALEDCESGKPARARRR